MARGAGARGPGALGLGGEKLREGTWNNHGRKHVPARVGENRRAEAQLPFGGVKKAVLLESLADLGPQLLIGRCQRSVQLRSKPVEEFSLRRGRVRLGHEHGYLCPDVTRQRLLTLLAMQ